MIQVCNEVLMMQVCKEVLMIQVCNEVVMMQVCNEVVMMQVCNEVLMIQVSVLVGRRMLHDARCQFVLLCVLSEAVIQLGNNDRFQATVLLDVVNLIELALQSVTADKVVFAII